MRKIILLIIVMLALVSAAMLTGLETDSLQFETNIADINSKEENKQQQNIILPGFAKLDINNPGKLLCNLNEDFYLQFNIILKDTDELIYSSGLVEYGGYINRIELNREIQKGEYDAIVFIQPYDLSMNKTNSAQLSVKIIL